MLNQCQFIGNLGQDPEVKTFQNGGRICNLRLAVTEKWKNKDGERQERTEWITVVISGDGLVGVAERYLRKGSKIFVQGSWRSRKWQDQSGNDRYSTEVVVGGIGGALTMLDGAPAGGSSGNRGGGGAGPADHGSQQQTWNDPEDDIPFISDAGFF